MKGWVYRLLERHAAWLRTLLLSLALAMLLLGWLLPLLVKQIPSDSMDGFQLAATLFAATWGALDALHAWLRRQHAPQLKEVEATIYELLRALERMAIERKHLLPLSTCGVKVWAVRPRSLMDYFRKESRKPLERVATSPFHRATTSSGLQWRVGMGVIGTALSENNAGGVDLEKLWGTLLDCDEIAWNEKTDQVRMGLTFPEFRRLLWNGGGTGPFVFALPYYKGERPLGVVALDMPHTHASALGLGDTFDEPDTTISAIMYALGRRAFEPQSLP